MSKQMLATFTPLVVCEGKEGVIRERKRGVVSSLECGASKDVRDDSSKGKGKRLCRQTEQCADAWRQKDTHVVAAE